MDAVKKHHFWILLGIAIPMILYGYMAANGALREATGKREGEIKAVAGAIPPSANPNTRFAEGMQAVNEKHKKQVDTALGSLWKDQAKRMVWPQSVASRIPKKYRDHIGMAPGFAYRREYPGEWEKVFYSLEPMVPPNITTTTHTQKVFVEPSALSVSTFHPTIPTTSEEVWDAQEDLWLLQMLADAVRESNKYADGPANATVRSIEALKLLGGTGTAVPKMAAGAAASSGGAEAMTMPMGGSGGQATGVSAGGAMINPAEEFGPDTDAAAAGGSMDASAAMPMAMGPAAVKRIRYIGAIDKTFKERGFYMRVIISQMKIPELLTTLTNCPWPVRIVRFNMSPNPHEKPFTPGSPMGPESFPMAGGAYEGGSPSYGASPFGGSPMGFTEGSGGAYPGSYDSGGGFGGVTNILAADAAGAANIIPGFVKVPDKFGALQAPDLIQLDVLGAITLYNPPTEEAKPEEAAPATEGAAPMTEGAAPVAEGAPADPAAAPMTPPADPAAVPTTPAATDPAKPAEPPMPTDPAATPPADPAAPPEGAAKPAEEAKPEAPPATETPGTATPPPSSN